ncbi:MAG: diguanylate cyclase [Pseudomonadota bacterium]
MRFCLLLLSTLLLLQTVFLADAAPRSVNDEICVLRGAETLAAQEVLAKRDQFDCGRDALLAEGNDIWILVDVRRAIAGLSDPALTLRMSYHGAITVAPVFDGVAVPQRHLPLELAGKSRVPDYMSFPLSRGLDRPEAILVRIEDAWDLTNWADISIESQASMDNRHIKGAILYALLSGLLLTPLIFTALMYITLRIGFLPYHFAMVSCAFVYALSWSGLIFALPFEITPIFRSQLNHFSIAGAFLFACLLTRSLCGEATIGQLWSRLLPIAGAIPCLVTVIVIGAAPNYSHVGSVILHAVYIFPLGAVLGALITGAVRGHLICRLQLLAWAPMIAYIILRILKGIGVTDHNLITEYGLYPSIISEALLTTVVIAYRVYTIRRSHEKALREQAVLRNLATTDPLTGALNRRAFTEHFEQTVAAPPAHRILTLILLDIDHFKRVNDTHGHKVGDEVLKDVVRVLQDQCRDEDRLARFGGEEFCLLMSTATKAAADGAVERMREAVAQHRFDEGCEITISLGYIAVDPSERVSFDQWYSAADKALYAAKTKGRNRAQRSYWSPAPIGTADDEAYASGWVPKQV